MLVPGLSVVLRVFALILGRLLLVPLAVFFVFILQAAVAGQVCFLAAYLSLASQAFDPFDSAHRTSPGPLGSFDPCFPALAVGRSFSADLSDPFSAAGPASVDVPFAAPSISSSPDRD